MVLTIYSLSIDKLQRYFLVKWADWKDGLFSYNFLQKNTVETHWGLQGKKQTTWIRVTGSRQNQGQSFSKHYISFYLVFQVWIWRFYLVDCSTCLLMCSCPIVVFLGFSRCLLMSFSVRPGQVTRKPCLISLRRIDVVGLKSYACKYCAVTGLVLLDTIYETHDNNNKKQY